MNGPSIPITPKSSEILYSYIHTIQIDRNPLRPKPSYITEASGEKKTNAWKSTTSLKERGLHPSPKHAEGINCLGR
tara:strand:- start:7447 stop:7674 length:228 start_codon:yes stop_codon:yes gene_type:complete